MSVPVRKVSFSLPPGVVDQLDYVSGKLRCSRSALLSQLLAQSMGGLVQIASCLPDKGTEITESDARRLRGESARIIGEEVAKLIRGAQDDLFKD